MLSALFSDFVETMIETAADWLINLAAAYYRSRGKQHPRLDEGYLTSLEALLQIRNLLIDRDEYAPDHDDLNDMRLDARDRAFIEHYIDRFHRPAGSPGSMMGREAATLARLALFYKRVKNIICVVPIHRNEAPS